MRAAGAIIAAGALIALAVVIFALLPHKTVISFAPTPVPTTTTTTTTTTWPGYGEGTLCGSCRS